MKKLLFLILFVIGSVIQAQTIDESFGHKLTGGTTAKLNSLPTALKLGLITLDTNLGKLVYWNGSSFEIMGGGEILNFGAGLTKTGTNVTLDNPFTPNTFLPLSGGTINGYFDVDGTSRFYARNVNGERFYLDGDSGGKVYMFFNVNGDGSDIRNLQITSTDITYNGTSLLDSGSSTDDQTATEVPYTKAAQITSNPSNIEQAANDLYARKYENNSSLSWVTTSSTSRSAYIDSGTVFSTVFGQNSTTNATSFVFRSQVSGRTGDKNLLVIEPLKGVVTMPTVLESDITLAGNDAVPTTKWVQDYVSNNPGSGTGMTTEQTERLAALDKTKFITITGSDITASNVNFTTRGTADRQGKVENIFTGTTNFVLDGTVTELGVKSLFTKAGSGTATITPDTGYNITGFGIVDGVPTEITGNVKIELTSSESAIVRKVNSTDYYIKTNGEIVSPPSNLYTENSSANGGTGVGSWASRSSGTLVGVADTDFVSGRAIAITTDGVSQFSGASLALTDAGVSTWSGGAVTSLDVGDVYRIQCNYKLLDAGAASYDLVRFGGVNLHNQSMSATTSIKVYTYDLTVSGASSSGDRLEFDVDINTPYSGTLYIGDLSITKIEDN